MSFHSLEKLIADLERQPGWERYRLFQQTLQSWSDLVGPNLARVSRPVKIDRNVLYVATSSSVIAQDLTMRRYDLLERIKGHLQADFVDMRFSTAKWRATRPKSPPQEVVDRVEPNIPPPALNSNLSDPNPQIALDRLANIIRQRSRDLPLCPSCQAPTPIAELNRWQVCACCAARNWSSKHI